MKRLSGLSFRNKLLLAFLLIGVVPLLIFTVLMLNIFRVTLAGNARDAAEAELSGAARAMDTLLAGGAVKIAASIALVSRPDIGIHGAPISTLLCYGLIAALNLGAIRRSIPTQVHLGEIFGKPLVMTAVMAVTARAVYGLLSRAAGNGVAVLGAIALAALVYGVLAVALGAVRREDLLALPKGEKIADKLHLR